MVYSHGALFWVRCQNSHMTCHAELTHYSRQCTGQILTVTYLKRGCRVAGTFGIIILSFDLVGITTTLTIRVHITWIFVDFLVLSNGYPLYYWIYLCHFTFGIIWITGISLANSKIRNCVIFLHSCIPRQKWSLLSMPDFFICTLPTD